LLERSRFESLALEHLDALHRMALQLTRRPDEAADLVQETYLRALRASGRFEERGGGIRSWLFTILHNTFYSHVKRAKRAPVAVDEFFDAESSETTPGEAPAVWSLGTLDWEHVDGRLKAAIDELKDEHRITLLLWGVEGLKYREIADITGVPIGTVMSRLHRARKILADQLTEFSDELGVRPSGTSDA